MPQMPKHRKAKRPTMLAKRLPISISHCFKFKSYKPLCQKLKTNNSTLAKALSSEKEESQTLFSQNVALMGEVQNLRLACTKRDAVISNILDNAKEMLKVMVTMTSYITKTIGSCQEFTATSGGGLHVPLNSNTRRESMRRLSTKSPTKGVVKPMVSGHTITKPTINLSRVNMQRIDNTASLSIIEEVRTPTRNQETDNLGSPTNSSVTQRRCATGRRCRMPERLTAAATPQNSGCSTVADENERRSMRREARNSRRISRRSTVNAPENIEQIGSPRVKLTDVSKLLQNSQTINVKRLSASLARTGMDATEAQTGDANVADGLAGITPTTSMIDEDLSSPAEPASAKVKAKTNNSLRETTIKTTADRTEISSASIDPLEGPSWLYNNSLPSKAPTDLSDSDEYQTTEASKATSKSSKSSKSSKTSKSSKSSKSKSVKTLKNAKPPKTPADNSKNGKISVGIDQEESGLQSKTQGLRRTHEVEPTLTNEVQNAYSENTMKFTNFVTQRRGYFADETEEEDMDDFTLIYTQHPRNLNFDINDLKLPVLEESLIRRPEVPIEPQPEVTTTVQKITQIIPQMRNTMLDESLLNQSTTVTLPHLAELENEDEDENENGNENQTETETETEAETESENRDENETETGDENANDTVISSPMEFTEAQRQTIKRPRRSNENSMVEWTPLQEQNGRKRKVTEKDPSTVKVVLQKLSDADVKLRTPSPEEMCLSQNNKSISSPVTSYFDDSSDSGSHSSAGSSLVSGLRLRRKKPMDLREPTLRTKLRRNR